jgi:hypothetical protein
MFVHIVSSCTVSTVNCTAVMESVMFFMTHYQVSSFISQRKDIRFTFIHFVDP